MFCGAAAVAEPLRIATYHAGLSRKGPGLLLQDLQKGNDPQIAAVLHVLTDAAPDILLLTDIDHDLSLTALGALRDQLAERGLEYPHIFAPSQNSGRDSGADLDADGRMQEPEDCHGFGFFTGDGGMALLSRYPIDLGHAQDFSELLWRDLPDGLMTDAAVPPEVQHVQRLSSTGHWIVPVETPGGTVHVMAFAATPPVFDGEEDRNGRRNHDEIMFWKHYLDGAFGTPVSEPFVLMGDANLDPMDGEGRNQAIQTLLSDPRLQDPQPKSTGAMAEANADHAGDPAMDTANWKDPTPGNLRVDYVLPSSDLSVTGSGVMWPSPETQAAEASRHGLVWVDLELPETP